MSQELLKKNIVNYKDLVINIEESRLKKCLKMIMAENPGRCLDVGCGSGEFSSKLIALGWDVYGVELVSEQVVLAEQKGIKAYQSNLGETAMPFESDFFDLVFAGEIIEHVIDTDMFILDLQRVTKPEGILIITTPNLASFENRIRLLFGVYPEWMDYSLQEGCGHVRAYTPKVLKRQLSKSGFKVLRHLGDWVPLLPRRYINDIKYPFLAKIADVFPDLASGIIIQAIKI